MPSLPSRDAVPSGADHAVLAALLGPGCNAKAGLPAGPARPSQRSWFQQVWKETASEQRGGQSDGQCSPTWGPSVTATPQAGGFSP